MPKKIIHVNRNVIQQNDKRNKKVPVCRVQEGSKTWYGSRIDILGPSSLVYSPDKPLRCGAKLWIETESDIFIHDKTTYAKIKQQ